MAKRGKFEHARGTMPLRIGVTMLIFGIAATIVLGLLDLAATFIIAEMIWFAASFVLMVTGILQTTRTPDAARPRAGWFPREARIYYDPKKHPDPPRPFHVMPVYWGSVPTRTADNALQVVRKLFRPKRERD